MESFHTAVPAATALPSPWAVWDCVGRPFLIGTGVLAHWHSGTCSQGQALASDSLLLAGYPGTPTPPPAHRTAESTRTPARLEPGCISAFLSALWAGAASVAGTPWARSGGGLVSRTVRQASCFLCRMREDNARVYENVGLMQQQKSFR